MYIVINRKYIMINGKCNITSSTLHYWYILLIKDVPTFISPAIFEYVDVDHLLVLR